MIEIFDTTRPGRDSQKRPTVPTRKSRKGQKGVISCLSFNPDHSNLYAAGSYLKTIGLYDARADELIVGGRRGEMGGVTQVQFSPDGQYLYSASRQDPWIRCWDIRDTAHVLHRLERPGDLTNQRIAFDISYDGRWLSTGDMSGDISVFDLTNPSDDKVDRLAARIHGHGDVVSAATFHPSGTILATCSGQRKYDLDLDSSDSSDAEDDTALVDNSIRLWTLPGEYVWY
ncbi:WD40-repeat-containing domain protein, partial [Dissophora ornata]